MRFTPAKIQVALNDSVIWEAADEGHTVTARDGSFDSSSRGLMAEGDQYRFRFRVPGTFGYFCRVHMNRGMVGEIVVVDPSAPATTTTRVTPVTAAATTSTMPVTTTTAPVTTTSRVLATSSSTSPAVATSTTAPRGTAALPNEAPAVNPATPVISPNPADEGDEISQAQAAATRSSDGDGGPEPLVVAGLLAVVAVIAAAVAFRTRPRRR